MNIVSAALWQIGFVFSRLTLCHWLWKNDRGEVGSGVFRERNTMWVHPKPLSVIESGTCVASCFERV